MQTKTKTANKPLPPGSMGLPGIGETPTFFLDKKFIAKRRAKHGDIFKTHLLGNPTICMVGPEAARFVLSTHMDHFSWEGGWPEGLKSLLADSLVLQDGEEHRKNRQLLIPAFNNKALAGYFDTINTIIYQYLDKWEQQREFAWYDEYRQITFDMTSQVLLGASSQDEVARLSDLFTTLSNGMYTPSVGLNLWPHFRRAMEARKEILEHVEAIVRQRAQNPTDDALSLLIKSRDEEGNSLSLKELTAQALLLLFAGHETTTAMITSVMMELSRHPEALERARAEQALLAVQGPLSFDQIKSMPYLDQVLREVERLHAPGIGGFREVLKDFEFNGYHVPAGWRILYSIYGTHRTESIYQDPERFDPDRFSPERAEHKKEAYSLIGFGGGIRGCMGKGLAYLEMKMILAHLLRSYQWDLLPNQRLDTILFPSIHPQDGVKVFFRHWRPEHAPAKPLEIAREVGPSAPARPVEAADEPPAAARCPYTGQLAG